MKKKFVSFLFALLLFPLFTTAQTNYEDVVYLKNGSIIHGMIIEQVPNKSIKIQTRDGNVFVYSIDEIDKMTKEQVSPTNNNSSIPNGDFKRSGFTNVTDLFLINVPFISYFGIETINGYMVNPYFSTGIGVGVFEANNSDWNIPLFLDLRGNFTYGQVSPFVSFDIGYDVTPTNNSTFYTPNGGYMLLSPAFGIKLFVSKSSALLFSLGYTNFIQTGPYSSESIGGLTFRLGATF